MTDVLKQLWACLTCSAKFQVGEVRPGAGAMYNDPWPCPRCGAYTIQPADGAVRSTPEYFGEIGTKN